MKNILKKITIYLLIAILSTNGLLPFVGSVYGEVAQINMTMDSSHEIVKTGETFYYSFDLASASLIEHLENTVITLELPSILSDNLVEINAGTENFIKNKTYYNDGGVWKYDIEIANDGTKFLAGTTLSFHVNVTTRNGSLIEGETIEVTSYASADNASTVFSSKTVSTDVATNYWKVSKTKTVPVTNPVPNSDVHYTLEVSDGDTVENQYGHMDLENVVLVDEFEDSAIVINSDGGVVDNGNNTITWNLSNLESGDIIEKNVILQYTTGGAIDIGSSIDNKAILTGTGLDGDPIIKEDTSTITLVQANVDSGSTFSSYSKYKYRSIGQELKFRLYNMTNTGNVYLEDYEVVNTLPPEIEDISVNIISDYSNEFSYTTGGAWTVVIPVNDKIDLSGIDVTQIKVNFGIVPPGFDGNKIDIFGTVKADTANGTISNYASRTFSYDGEITTTDRSSSVIIESAKPWIAVDKTVVGSESQFLPNDTVSFEVIASNIDFSTGMLYAPIIFDILPENFQIVSESFVVKKGNTVTSPAAITIDENVVLDGKTRTMIKIEFGEDLSVNESFKVTYDTTVNDGTPPTLEGNIYSTDVYLTPSEANSEFWWSNSNIEHTPRTTNTDLVLSNLDASSLNEVNFVKDAEIIIINEYGLMESVKWNIGELSSEYTRQPDVTETLGGGVIDYKIILENKGNVNFKSINLLDIFSFVGDRGVLIDSPRGSEWRPNLIEEIPNLNYDESSADPTDDGYETTANINTYFSLSNDSSLINLESDVMDTNIWIDEIGDDFDITKVNSMYLEIVNINSGAGLEPGESIELSWQMRVPVGTPENLTAWSSFAYQPTSIHDTKLLAAEPLRVGAIVVENIIPERAYDIGGYAWFDENKDAIQNETYNPEGSGLNGLKVYLYKNDGGYSLYRTTLTASNTSGLPGYYQFPALTTGEYRVDFEVPAYLHPTTKDIGTDDLDSDISFTISGGVYQSDIITIVDSTESYDIDAGFTEDVASTNEINITNSIVDIDTLDSSVVDLITGSFNVGEKVYYEVKIENTGDVPQINTIVIDQLPGFVFRQVSFNSNTDYINISNSVNVTKTDNSSLVINRINSGEKYYLKGEYVIDEDDLVNGELINNVVTSSNSLVEINSEHHKDTAHIGVLATGDVSEANVGDTINFETTITNRGNVDLVDLDVSNDYMTFDSSIFDDANITGNANKAKILSLSVGEDVTLTGSYTAVSGDFSSVTNTTTVESALIREDITDNASFTVTDYEYTTNISSDILSGIIGDSVVYTFTATNTGQSHLTDINIVDDVTGLNETFNLNVGETKTFNTTYVTDFEGDLINTLTSSSADAGSVVKTNTVTVLPLPIYDLVATVDITDVETLDGSEFNINDTLNTGEKAFYEIKVLNTGDAALENIIVTELLANFVFKQISHNVNDSYEDIVGHANVVSSSDSQVTIENINVGDSYYLSGEYIVENIDGKVSNVVTVSADSVSEFDVMNIRNIADFDVTTTSDVSDANVGDTVNFTTVVTNTGKVDLVNVNVSDNYMAFDASVFEDSNITENINEAIILTLLVGESVTLTGTYTVASDDFSSIENTTSIECSQVREVITDNTSITVTDYKLSASLTSDISTGIIGDSVVYTFTVVNTGQNLLAGVSIVDDITGLNETFDLNVGETKVFNASHVTISEGDLVNNLTVNSSDTGFVIKTNTVTVLPIPIYDLVTTLNIVDVETFDNSVFDVNDDLNTGEKVLYEIEVLNAGNVSIENIEITELLSDFVFKHISYNTSDNYVDLPGHSNVISSSNLQVTLDSINSGESYYLLGEYIVENNDGEVVNTITIGADSVPEHNITDRRNIADLEVSTISDVSVSHTGNIINYTTTITNTGNIDIENITITDDKVAYDELSVSNLLIGESVDVAGTYTPVLNDYNNLTTTTNIECDDIRRVKSATANVDIKNYQLEVEIISDTKIYLGNTVEYTVNVTNTGLDDLTGVNVTDDLLVINETFNLMTGETITFTSSYEANELGDIVNTVLTDCNELTQITAVHTVSVSSRPDETKSKSEREYFEEIISVGEEDKAVIVVKPEIIEDLMDEILTSEDDKIIKIEFTSEDIVEAEVVIPTDIINELGENDFDLSVEVGDIVYKIPAAAINTDNSTNIKVVIEEVDLEIEEELVVPPIAFEIISEIISEEGEILAVEIDKFEDYVERIIRIPDNVDPNRITTGIIINEDGTFSHIPTVVTIIDGIYHAKLNSLTNSIYSIIWNPVIVPSVESHWSQESVNDMASRLVVREAELFKPDDAITRGELTDIIVTALGLHRSQVGNSNLYSDIPADNKYIDSITKATEYGIVAGYPDGTFRADQNITREESMVMFKRAMETVDLAPIDNYRIDEYEDVDDVSEWAYEFAKDTVSVGVFNGRTETTIVPKGIVTCAESIQAMRNLLIIVYFINK